MVFFVKQQYLHTMICNDSMWMFSNSNSLYGLTGQASHL